MKVFGYIFFFLMLVIPGTFQGVRGALLAGLLFAAIMFALKHKLRLNPWISGLTVFCVLSSLLFMTWGGINDAPGALKVGTVFVLWPILFVFIMGTFHEIKFWEPYLKVIVIASIAVEITCILIVTDEIGITHFGIINIVDANVAIYEGMSQFHLQSMGTLIFSVPYLIAKLVCPDIGISESQMWKKIEYATLFGGVIVLILAGRKALILVSMLAPLISILFVILAGGKIQMGRLTKFAMVGFMGLILVNLIHEIDYKVIWDFMASGFAFSEEDTTVNISVYRRKEQFAALMSGWESNPLFGSGHGSAASDNVAVDMDVQPWAYELQYLALLFQVGIVGLIIYAGSTIWLYCKSLILMRRDASFRFVMIPLLTGLTAFLIANATNPYLGKFDYLWVLFLPIAVLNSFLVHKKPCDMDKSC